MVVQKRMPLHAYSTTQGCLHVHFLFDELSGSKYSLAIKITNLIKTERWEFDIRTSLLSIKISKCLCLPYKNQSKRIYVYFLLLDTSSAVHSLHLFHYESFFLNLLTFWEKKFCTLNFGTQKNFILSQKNFYWNEKKTGSSAHAQNRSVNENFNLEKHFSHFSRFFATELTWTLFFFLCSFCLPKIFFYQSTVVGRAF